MFFCRIPVVWSSVDGLLTLKRLPDCSPIVGRWTADDRPMQNWSVHMSDRSAMHNLNVNALYRPICESTTGLIGRSTLKSLVANA